MKNSTSSLLSDKFDICTKNLDIHSSAIKKIVEEENKFNRSIPELDIHSSIRKILEEEKSFNIDTKKIDINNTLYEASQLAVNSLYNTFKDIEEFNKENKNIVSNSSINNFLSDAIKNAEELRKKEYVDIAGSITINSLYEILKHSNLSLNNSLSDAIKNAEELRKKEYVDIAGSITINSLYEALKHSNLSLNNSLSDAIKNAEELRKKEYVDIAGSITINSLYETLKHSNLSLNNSLSDAIKNAEELRKKEYVDIAGSITINSLYETLKHSQELLKKDYANFIELNYKKCFSDSINKVFLKLEEDENLNLKAIDKNEIEELKNDLYSINNTNNWQLKLMDYWEKWSKKNPIYNRIILIIYGLLIAIFTALIINIMDKNNSKSNVIYQTTVNNITIIGDVKYYYEVETKDNEGSIIKGYVSKRKYNHLKSNKTVQK
ncbi:hypothetical protein OFR20_05575 [Brachyspira hyodysenteriae]|uniref:hypothetical protein n=2 Tax=Brachyspira hyodysenteriae TaxID=159 RepID=UPI0022CD51C4|nr:hypothetical protein [Brachyspira hyodysenteriae]MCZ9980992.1 hypothetical protein [Brachyspira hyodysenteriae]